MYYSAIEGLNDGDSLVTTLRDNIDTLKTPLNSSKGVDYLTPTEILYKPISTTMDAKSEDINDVIVQQNLLYTVATLTAATFLITAVVLANNR